MGKCLKEILLMVKSTVMGFIDGQITLSLRVFIKMILSMVWVNLQIQTGKYLKENGYMVSDKVKD